MRMWMVDPSWMCRDHLLGEHRELHMIVGTINKGTDLTGYLDNGLLEVHNLRARHEALVAEMSLRGYFHTSPLKEFQVRTAGRIDPDESSAELLCRCIACYTKWAFKTLNGKEASDHWGAYQDSVRQLELLPTRAWIRIDAKLT
jgi:hypothetical protein